MFKKMVWIVSMAAIVFLGFSTVEKQFASASGEKLIDENFDQGTMPENWNVIQGNAEVTDSKLLLTSPNISNPSRVLIPMPKGTGDYVFEADMTFKSAVNDARWASLMYRVQNEDYPYYQFAVRRGTSALNGLEFAIRTESNSWNVPEKTFYPEDFQYGDTHRLKVIVKDNRVQHFVNGQLVIDTDLADTWYEGDLGFQVSGATVEFDNVLVKTRTEDLPPMEDNNAFLPDEPETNMLNAPTVISSYIPNEISQLEGVSSTLLPAELNESGDISVGDQLLTDLLDEIRGKFIPVIKVEDVNAVPGVIDVLDSASINDAHVLSSNLDIIREIKEAHPTVRGTVLYEKNHLNKHDLQKLVEDANLTNSMTVALPEKLITTDTVHFFHARAIAVWGIGDDIHSLIHNGVDGIVTSSPSSTVNAFSQYPEKTLVQRPIVVAHRGVPSLAPENTMAGYNLAYDLGADLIETDIQQTKDGHLIIMHDSTVNRTTNGTGKVSDLTLNEIRQLDAGIIFGPDFEGEKVPTFKEFLDGFKKKDVVLLVELKADNIEEAVLQEIKDAGIEDKVVLQSFSVEHVKKFREIAPEMSVGYLYSSSVAATPEARVEDAQQMMNYATAIGARLNSSHRSLSEESVTYLRQRGMISMHWTFRSQPPLEDLLKKGLIGPITDYTQWLTDAPTIIETPIKKRNLKVGKSATIKAKTFVNYRADKKKNIETTLFTEGNLNVVDVNKNTITALSPGQADVFAIHTFDMIGEEWNLVSKPIRVNVSR
ncbi:Glycerophosphodiester phosphodiesterase [Lentibacillus sp. JNUCC-1]|uniref:glycerophosphodiester phosphodiesterase family protein n=1 Tax=Lentibacillus sp. JNUCC-1 TaxID=2654513 RepID=UPI0012E7D15A|nr:glycerophosphodiester phosphodiesterase family protein [Lentibacillus sp. JNUCC-1]MUV37093.1 Glycerophosphodiester phosphodiesterase [Lentibacillus sp. JNUCC-1]